MTQRCKNCDIHIIYDDTFISGWVHKPEDATTKDGVYIYCKRTIAEPLVNIIYNVDKVDRDNFSQIAKIQGRRSIRDQ